MTAKHGTVPSWSRWLLLPAETLAWFGRVLTDRPLDKSLTALAVVDEDEVSSLSETGLRLRREVLRAQGRGSVVAAADGTGTGPGAAQP